MPVAPSPSSAYMNGSLSSVSYQTGRQFQRQYNMNDPARAMTEYARLMLRHTQQQMEIACRNAQRTYPEQMVHGQAGHTVQMAGIRNVDARCP